MRTGFLQTGRGTRYFVENSSVGYEQASPEVSYPDIQRFGKRFHLEQSIAQGEGEAGPVEQTQGEDAIRIQDADSETAAQVFRRSEPSGERCDSIITLYLREIGRVKLLRPQEELELAARIKDGDAEAREMMITANLRLVVKIARGYEGLGMPLLDLISEGNIGLMRAVERFDARKGGKLSTYGAWWIKQAIIRALACQSKATRLPTHVMPKLCQARRAAARLQEELGREPTHEELAKELGTTAFRLNRMRMAAIGPVSLDAEVAGEESRSYAETIADEKAEMPYQQLENESVRVMVRNAIETLTEREKAVLSSRFGLNGRDPKNLEEVGNELNITDERARQIQNAAFVKLRRKIKKWEQIEPARREQP